jgi:hypothetical protein
VGVKFGSGSRSSSKWKVGTGSGSANDADAHSKTLHIAHLKALQLRFKHIRESRLGFWDDIVSRVEFFSPSTVHTILIVRVFNKKNSRWRCGKSMTILHMALRWIMRLSMLGGIMY